MRIEDPRAIDTGGESFLVIVSRREPWLFATLTRVFESNDRVQVILDRRADPPPPAATLSDRRQHDVSASLRALGWAVVIGPTLPRPEPTTGRRDDVVVSGRA